MTVKMLSMLGPFKFWSKVELELGNVALTIHNTEKGTVMHELQLCCLHATRYLQNPFLSEEESK